MSYISHYEKVRRINESYEVVKIIRQNMRDLKNYVEVLEAQSEEILEILKEKYFENREISDTLVGLNKHSKLYYELHKDLEIREELQSKYWKAHDVLSDEESTKIWDRTSGNLVADYQEAFTSAELLRRTAENFIEIYSELEREYDFITKEIAKAKNTYLDLDKKKKEVEKQRVMYQNLPVDHYLDFKTPYYKVPKQKGISKNKTEYISEPKFTFIDTNGNAHISGSKDVFDYKITKAQAVNGEITFGEVDKLYSQFDERNSSQIINEDVYPEEKEPIIYVGSKKR